MIISYLRLGDAGAGPEQDSCPASLPGWGAALVAPP